MFFQIKFYAFIICQVEDDECDWSKMRFKKYSVDDLFDEDNDDDDDDGGNGVGGKKRRGRRRGVDLDYMSDSDESNQGIFVSVLICLYFKFHVKSQYILECADDFFFFLVFADHEYEHEFFL